MSLTLFVESLIQLSVRPDEFPAEGVAAQDDVPAEALMMLTMLGIEEDR